MQSRKRNNTITFNADIYSITSCLLEADLTFISGGNDTLFETQHKHKIEIRNNETKKSTSLEMLHFAKSYTPYYLENTMTYILTHSILANEGFQYFCEWFLQGENYSTAKALELFKQCTYYLETILPVFGNIDECNRIVDLLFDIPQITN